MAPRARTSSTAAIKRTTDGASASSIPDHREPAPEHVTQRKAKVAKSVAPNVFRLGYLVHDVSRMRRTLCDQEMRPLGITRSQWWVLANLSRQTNEGTSSTELAKILDVGKVSVGGIIDRLEAAGYVYRRVDKHDRRAKRLFITQAGFALIAKMREVLGPLNQGICAGLTDEEVDTIEKYLAIIRGNLREMLAEEDADTGHAGDFDDMGE
jgi:DNA-binding MarR family transcriptional regulator